VKARARARPSRRFAAPSGRVPPTRIERVRAEQRHSVACRIETCKAQMTTFVVFDDNTNGPMIWSSCGSERTKHRESQRRSLRAKTAETSPSCFAGLRWVPPLTHRECREPVHGHGARTSRGPVRRPIEGIQRDSEGNTRRRQNRLSLATGSTGGFAEHSLEERLHNRELRTTDATAVEAGQW
jgi:hypothetical protein